MRRRQIARRLAALMAATALMVAGCDGDDGETDDGVVAPDEAADDETTDGGDADGPTDDRPDTEGADGGEPAPEELPEPESVVTVEPLDAPQSSAEIRVGEIIIEFDGEVTDEGTVLTLEEPILFDFDSFELRSGSGEALDEIAEVVAFYEGAPVEVIGHTDDVGEAAYNEELSANRAEAVFGGLVERGIPEDRMTSEGRGFEDPKVPNDSDENRAINRRVEVLIVGVTPPDQDG